MNINHEFYTSYFGNIRNIVNTGAIPIAICGKCPDWYDGLWYKKLAPSYSIFSEYKYHGMDSVKYTNRYMSEILGRLDPHLIAKEMCDLADLHTGKQTPIVMLCYEKPGDFCHRNLVSAWFEQAGIPCSEWR